MSPNFSKRRVIASVETFIFLAIGTMTRCLTQQLWGGRAQAVVPNLRFAKIEKSKRTTGAGINRLEAKESAPVEKSQELLCCSEKLS